MGFESRAVARLVPWCAVLSLAVAGAPAAADHVPMARGETLYVNGMAWGKPESFNMLNPNSIFPCNLNQFFTYEALFMYNQLTGDLEPLVGTSYAWNGDSSLTVELNELAHWNDGVPLTAEDVAYSFLLGKRYPTPWSGLMQYVEDVKVISPRRVAIIPDQSKLNRLVILTSLVIVPLHPKHVWTGIEKQSGGDIEKMRAVPNFNPVGSGPY